MDRKPEPLTPPELRSLCVELQSRGVRIKAGHAGRSGGAGPAEGHTIVVGGLCITVPSASWYVARSPYHLAAGTGGPYVCKNGEPVAQAQFLPEPVWYGQTTPDGIPLRRIALMHGTDCLASTVYQDCAYWSTPRQCRFCGIGLSLEQGSTILRKKPADLALAASLARRHDGARHATLTTGAWRDEAAGLAHLCDCVREIKNRTVLPVHAQVHLPRNTDDFTRLKHAGVDTLGLHVESCSPELLARLAPGKAALGMTAYRKGWRAAVDIFGPNQVSSFLIAGCGETLAELTAMADTMAGLGVFPFILPLRPIPRTPLADLTPPDPSYMKEAYAAAAAVLTAYGLASCQSRAGCVRCGACSCLRLYEMDAFP